MTNDSSNNVSEDGKQESNTHEGMLSAMGMGNWDIASEECLNSKYAKDVGRRAKRISETIRTGRFIV